MRQFFLGIIFFASVLLFGSSAHAMKRSNSGDIPGHVVKRSHVQTDVSDDESMRFPVFIATPVEPIYVAKRIIKSSYVANPYFCPEAGCLYKNGKKPVMEVHAKMHQEDPAKIFRCEICHFLTKRSDYFSDHTKAHQPPTYICHCGKKFAREYCFRRHIKDRHDGTC